MSRLDAFCEHRRRGRPSATLPLRIFSLHRQVARIATVDAAGVYMAVDLIMRERKLDHCVFTLGDPVGDPELGFFVVTAPGDDDVTISAMEDCPKDVKLYGVIDE